MTPYYNKATQKGLIQHYTAIADSVNIPMILYSVPGRTGVNIKPPTVLELSKHPNIVAIKEASGNISQCAEIARLVPDDFAMYSGNDDMVTPLLALGGDGVISVLSNVAPKETHDMVQKFFDGDIRGAIDIQLKAKPLIDALFAEVNPIPVKAALDIMGRSKMNFRLPLCETGRIHDETSGKGTESFRRSLIFHIFPYPHRITVQVTESEKFHLHEPSRRRPAAMLKKNWLCLRYSQF